MYAIIILNNQLPYRDESLIPLHVTGHSVLKKDENNAVTEPAVLTALT